jgi:malate dehydrogenase
VRNGINAGIVKTVTQNVLEFSPEAIIVVVSNPMDTMTYLALKSAGLPKNRIIGMGGALDSSRFRTYLSMALDKPANDTAVGLGFDSFSFTITESSFSILSEEALQKLLLILWWWCNFDRSFRYFSLVCTQASVAYLVDSI